MFDFDGTLSLIRQGWPEVMVPMFVEMLPRKAGETDADLRRLAYDDIMRLNGKQTIFQMIQLAERITERGGSPREPMWYKHEYLRRLDQRIGDRIEGLRSGRIRPDDLLVHGSRQLLEQLSARGLTLYLASGTDEPAVKAEAELLDVARYFGPRIFGAQDDYQNFSKQMVIDRILRDHAISGERLLAFGDGYVEIQNTKGVGGLAVAVASDEAQQRLRAHGSLEAAAALGRRRGCRDSRLSRRRSPAVLPDSAVRGRTEIHACRRLQPRDMPPQRRQPGRCPMTWSRPPLDLRQVRVYPLAQRKSLTRVEEILVDPAAAPNRWTHACRPRSTTWRPRSARPASAMPP